MTKKVSHSRTRQVSKSTKRSVKVKRTSTRDRNAHSVGPEKNQKPKSVTDKASLELETLDRDAPYNKTYGMK